MPKYDFRLCITCRLWESPLGIAMKGKCRANSPVIIIFPLGGIETRWPMTAHEDWCGEYRMDLDKLKEAGGSV